MAGVMVAVPKSTPTLRPLKGWGVTSALVVVSDRLPAASAATTA